MCFFVWCSFMYPVNVEGATIMFDGKVVLVTGSSRGIGAAIASAFARQGAQVVVHGRNEEALEVVASRITHEGGACMTVTADVTRFAEIETMRGEIEERLGPVDVLVANAGGNPTPPAPIEDISEADWQADLDANLTATFLTLKSFLPGMKQRGHGNLITIGSAAGRQANPHAPLPYAVAKMGLVMLTQGVAAQAGPYGVRANCIAPATILTERNQQRIPPEQQQNMLHVYPLQRLGTPEDVAQAAVFLASDAASWITGTVLDVAGGSMLL
jgi:3-oxoacyl-[acyl-carrier protein] reductase